MTCLRCAHSAIRDRSDAKRDDTLRFFNRRGMVNCCKSSGRATFYPMNHNCDDYAPAAPEAIAARERWAATVSRETQQARKA